MKKRLFDSRQEAYLEIKKAVAGLVDLHRRYGRELCEEQPLYSAGPSVISLFNTLCESLLYLVCCAKASPDGTEEFPRLKELKKKGDLVNITPFARYAADRMTKISNQCMKYGPSSLSAESFEEYLQCSRIFIDWTMETLQDLGMMQTDEAHWMSREIDRIMDLARDWIKGCAFERQRIDMRLGADRNDYRRSTPENLMEFIVYKNDIDEDSMTDEELDELYRPRKTNSRKELAILYIFIILQERTDRDHRLHINDLVEILDEEYDIRMERKAIGRKVENLAQDDLNICKELNGGGFWYEKPENK